ncbi:MAG: hypothetical protein N2C14_09835 [Planctomycetales bacterium]
MKTPKGYLTTPPRTPFQFSLRRLMAVMLIAGAAFGWFGSGWRQAEAVDALKAMGARVEHFRDNSYLLNWFVNVEAVYLSDTQVTDADLAPLRRLTQLEWLVLSRTQIGDEGLVHIQGLTRLRVLWLDGTQVTDAGLVHLHGLTRLRELHLEGTQVTDAGADALRQALPNCEIYHQPRSAKREGTLK